MGERIVVPGGHARAAAVRAGQRVEIVNVEGEQVCDFIAFDASDMREYLSTSHTRTMLNRLDLKVGDRLYSVARRPMFELVEDTVGRHDMLWAACDRARYLLDFGIEGHRNCRENFAEALADRGLGYGDIPDPINWFQNTPVLPDRSFGLGVSPAKPGDRVVLRALVDAVVAASACPQDQTELNGWRPTDILLVVG